MEAISKSKRTMMQLITKKESETPNIIKEQNFWISESKIMQV